MLSRLSRLVYSVERYRTLLKDAEARLKSLHLMNIITKFGDGGEGWPEQAPFDRIMVTAAMDAEPTALLAQFEAQRRLGRADRAGAGAEPEALCGRRTRRF